MFRKILVRRVVGDAFSSKSTPELSRLNVVLSSSVSTNSKESVQQALKEHNTNFGFKKVSEDRKEEKVKEIFDSVASNYDLMNDATSFGIHRCWKDYLVEKIRPVPGMQLLDLAGGTGDIARRFIREAKTNGLHLGISSEIETAAVVCDINAAMLEVGKKKAANFNKKLTWLEANAEELPLGDNEFDVVTIGFGIRNVTHIDKVLSESYRVLKPGGRFLCLEFSQVENPLLAKLYDLYSFQVIPVMGQVLAGDWKSYQYLVESIRKFPGQEIFADMIRDSGFRCVTYENLFNGVAAIHMGFKL